MRTAALWLVLGIGWAPAWAGAEAPGQRWPITPPRPSLPEAEGAAVPRAPGPSGSSRAERSPVPDPGATEPHRVTAFVDVDVAPMDADRLLRDQTVLVVDDRIAWIGPNADATVPVGARVVDGHGFVMMPGLADMHVHVYDEADLPLFLAAGVTTVTNMSGTPLHLEWREALRRGDLEGPTLYTTGPMIDEQSDPVFGVLEEVGSEAQARQVVAEHAAAGYDFVKMHGDLEVGLYDAVSTAAKEHDLRVVGHVSFRVGLLHAMQMSQASVEHTDEFVNGFFNDRFEVRRIPIAVEATRAGGAHVTPTLVSIDVIGRMLTDQIDGMLLRPANLTHSRMVRATWGRETNPYRRHYAEAADAQRFVDSLAFQKQLTGALQDGGVPLMTGTDAGWLPLVLMGTDVHSELELLVEAGLTPYEALVAATRTPGAFVDGSFGTIAAGQRADLVLVRDNPLEDVSATRSVSGVMARGRWYGPDELARLLDDHAARNDHDAHLAAAFAQQDWSAVVSLARPLVKAGKLRESQVRVLAMLLYQAGRFPEAVRVLEMNAEAHPGSWSAQQLLARAYLAAGHTDLAAEHLRRALAADPTPAATAQIQREIQQAG